jgi:hypothetical protein
MPQNLQKTAKRQFCDVKSKLLLPPEKEKKTRNECQYDVFFIRNISTKRI